MNILYILVPVALILAGSAVAAFAWAVRHGQFDDVHTPAIRILLDDEESPHEPSKREAAHSPEGDLNQSTSLREPEPKTGTRQTNGDPLNGP